MEYIEKTKKLLYEVELYPGQQQEIISLAGAMGCDINEHVPTLIEYGKKCKTITEMGVRFGWSTRCFLYTKPNKLVSIDKYSWGSIEQAGGSPQPGNFYYEQYKKLYEGIVDYQFVLSDTTKIDPIKETELLFIDTFHHRDCLKIELKKHGNQATKFILLHDTETFGQKGQSDASCTFVDFPCTDELGTGLWYAINPWLVANPQWKIKQHYTNNNGLTILERL